MFTFSVPHPNCSGAATSAAKLNGVSKVLCVDSEVFGNGMAEPIADLVVSMSGDYEHIIAPATNSAKNILPRVAALLDVMVITDITGVIDSKTFERPIYAGNAIQTVESSDHKRLFRFVLPILMRLMHPATRLLKT